jgi:hypothetical protein
VRAKQSASGQWSALQHMVVEYFFRYKGKKVWHYKGYSRTSASGHFSKAITQTQSGPGRRCGSRPARRM